MIDRQEDLVADYLTRHQDLIQVTCELAKHVRLRFPSPDQLVLELFSDPDSSDEFLILNVRQAEYSEDLIQVLEDLSEPFLPRLTRASGWLVLSSDFIVGVGDGSMAWIAGAAQETRNRPDPYHGIPRSLRTAPEGSERFGGASGT